MGCEQAEMVGITKYKCTVFNQLKINPANNLQSLKYIVDCTNWKLNQLEKSSRLIMTQMERASLVTEFKFYVLLALALLSITTFDHAVLVAFLHMPLRFPSPRTQPTSL